MIERDSGRERLEDMGRIILFIGPEGSGKTTMAMRLAEDCGKPYITTGDILRDLAANDPGEWGNKCRVMFEQNTYLDGETLLEILIDRFRKEDTVNGFVLDGGLRTLEETLEFQLMLERAERGLPLKVIYLELPKEKSYERLVSGENARKRNDDTYEGVTKRLEKFYHQLEERIQVIENQPNWELVRIDALESPDRVYEQVCVNVLGAR